MESHCRDINRDKMAVELFYSVLRLKKSQGIQHMEARKLAYDAVELRYNISSKRLRNIMAANHDTLTCNRDAFLEECRTLIMMLKESNSDMQKTIEYNNELVTILEGVCNV